MQRNNIATRYPRAAKVQLVRWREVDGMMPGEIAERAASEWPDLPAIHGSTWLSWSKGREYADLRAMVCAEETKRTDLTRLFEAAGGNGALSDVADSAAYALAAKAMEAAEDAESAKEIRTLMATVRDAKSVADERARQRYEKQLADLRAAHADALAQLQADNEALAANVDRLVEILAGAGIDPDAERESEGGLSDAALKQIEEKAKLL